MADENEIVIRVRRDREGDEGGRRRRRDREGGDEDGGRRGGPARGAFLGGVVGGAVGSVAGAALGGLAAPFDPLLQALGGILAAAILPIAIGLMPLLVEFARLVSSAEFQQLMQSLAGLVGKLIELFAVPAVQFLVGLGTGPRPGESPPSQAAEVGQKLRQAYDVYASGEAGPAVPGSTLDRARVDYESYLRWRGITQAERPFDVAAAVGIGAGHASADIVMQFFPFLRRETPDPDSAYSNPAAARAQGGP